jgi:hypothetical protein
MRNIGVPLQKCCNALTILHGGYDLDDSALYKAVRYAISWFEVYVDEIRQELEGLVKENGWKYEQDCWACPLPGESMELAVSKTHPYGP